jgi:hypothetical protein
MVKLGYVRFYKALIGTDLFFKKSLKGTVARDFLTQFFIWFTFCGAHILRLQGKNSNATIPLRQSEIFESTHFPPTQKKRRWYTPEPFMVIGVYITAL